METWKLIVTAIGLLLILAGVVMVYDARVITKKKFSFKDQNSTTRWIKVSGVFAAIIGAGIIIFI